MLDTKLKRFYTRGTLTSITVLRNWLKTNPLIVIGSDPEVRKGLII